MLFSRNVSVKSVLAPHCLVRLFILFIRTGREQNNHRLAFFLISVVCCREESDYEHVVGDSNLTQSNSKSCQSDQVQRQITKQ